MMQIKTLFDTFTNTLTHIVYDEQSKDAVVIDPVLNYDPNASKITIDSIEQVLQFLLDENLKLHFILETHAHADHITGSAFIQDHNTLTKVGIGANITLVQKTFAALYNFQNTALDGSQFDVLLQDGQTYQAGTLNFKVLFTPGHTQACVSYLFADALFTGDALFMPDYGCGRCDFPGGDARQLYRSIQNQIYTLPDATRVFTGHDYQPGGRELAFESTVGEQKSKNIQIPANISENDFVQFRTARDKTLTAPRLLWPSVQINVFGGQLPEAEDNGIRYLKLPLR